jgi:hypothetical protein
VPKAKRKAFYFEFASKIALLHLTKKREKEKKTAADHFA